MSQCSVIIPAKGRADLLVRALNSVFAQTHRAYEIIVVDDGSEPPLEPQLPRALLAKIILLRHSPSRNAAYSRNYGVEYASGEQLAFLDSDDIWQPEHLACISSALKKQPDKLYVTPSTVVPSQTIGNVYDFLFLQGGDFRTSGLALTKTAFDRLGGFDAKLDKHQDWDFCFRAAKHMALQLGETNTVFLDVYAQARMSAKPNVAASKYFYEKHQQAMADPHKSVFFSGVLRACVLSSSWAELADVTAWAKKEVPTDSLDSLAKLCLKSRSIGWLALQLNELRRSLASKG